MNRREFLTAAGVAGAAPLVHGAASPEPGAAPFQTASTGAADRETWIAVTRRLADPVLNHLAAGTLKARMPVEQAAGAESRQRHAPRGARPAGRRHRAVARAVGRVRREAALPAKYADLARRAIARAVDPSSPDFMNFTHGRPAAGRRRLPRAGTAARAEGAGASRSDAGDGAAGGRARIDARDHAGLQQLAAVLRDRRGGAGDGSARSWDRMRVDYALRQHEQWYKGDGVYGDGPAFHWDYYNSFVIQPMLLDVLDVCRDELPAWKDMATRVERRARGATPRSRSG